MSYDTQSLPLTLRFKQEKVFELHQGICLMLDRRLDYFIAVR